jgi:hypothetical protein
VLLDARQHLHPYLFEHHPERNVRSFFRTLRGGLRPRKFWSELKPVQPVRGRRLLIYWILIALVGGGPVLAGMVTLSVIEAYNSRMMMSAPPPSFPPPSLGSGLYSGSWPPPPPPPPPPTPWEIWRDAIDSAIRDAIKPVAPYVLLQLGWPWITFATLMIFQISMRRAGIRKIHVVRCVVYCSDIIVWTGLMTLFVAGAALAYDYRTTTLGGGPFYEAMTDYAWVLILMWPIMAYRLYIAYKKYLAFDMPLATIIASQIMTGLVVLAVVLYSQW